jgi:hypothetical protein
MRKRPVKDWTVALLLIVGWAWLTQSNCCAAQKDGGREFSFPTTGVRVAGQAVLLAIDDQSLPLRHHLCLYLAKPTVRAEPVLAPSRDNPLAPDYLAAHFYGTVLDDGGKFRMWYYPVSFGNSETDLTQGPVCYAESDDGIQWTRPILNQVEFKGTTRNNAVRLPDERIEGVNVIKDVDDPDPKGRYKMVYNPHNGRTFTIRTATSPDGIHWTARASFPKDEFFEQASFFKHNSLYLVHGQALGVGEGGGERGRQGYCWISPDFDHWLEGAAEAFALAEPREAADRGSTRPYDQVHLGVGGASFGNVVVGLYGLWHNYPGDTSRKIPNSWFGHEKTSCDLGLVVSNDGIHFREPVKGHVFISRVDSPVTAVDGKTYPTILIQAGGILNVGHETRIYHGRWRNAVYGKDYWGEVALATIPRDRWGALGVYEGESEGTIWSAPLTLPPDGCQISLNADAVDAIGVEIADERFELLDAYSGENRGTAARPSGLDCPLSWPAGNPAALGGKTVRLRVHLKRNDGSDPRLYAIYLKTAKE